MERQLFKSFLMGLVLSSITVPATLAATLVGGVTVNDALPAAPKESPKQLRKMIEAKIDKSESKPLPSNRDCICFSRDRIEIKEINGSWKVVDGDHWILDFASNAANAQLAGKTIRDYKLNEICFVGRNIGRPMMYFLSDGGAPQGRIDGEDAIPFDSNLIKAEEINGTWKLTCGDMWMEDFGPNPQAAKDAAEQIKYYGFSKQCYIGRPGAPMEYFTK